MRWRGGVRWGEGSLMVWRDGGVAKGTQQRRSTSNLVHRTVQDLGSTQHEYGSGSLKYPT